MPHLAALLRVARRLTLESASAEDLVQETMLLAWRGFHGFETGTNARAWLFRILFNVFHGAGRKARIEPLPSQDSVRPMLQEALEIAQALGRIVFGAANSFIAQCSGRIHLPGDRGNPGRAHRHRDVAVKPGAARVAKEFSANGERSISMTDDELDQRLRDRILSEEIDTSRVAAAVRHQIRQRKHFPRWAFVAATAAGIALAAFLWPRTTPGFALQLLRIIEREIVKSEPRHWLTDLPAIQSLAEKQGVPASRNRCPGHHRLPFGTCAAVFP